MGRPKKNVSEEIIKQYNLELQLANNSSKSFFKTKSGKTTSCLMCQKRKTKCIKTTNKNSCLNCLKSGIKCVQPEASGGDGNTGLTDLNTESKDVYIKFLEGKLASLEESLNAMDDLGTVSNSKQALPTFNFSKHQKFHKKILKYKRISSFLQSSSNDYDLVIDKLYNDIKAYESKDKLSNIVLTEQQKQNNLAMDQLIQQNKAANDNSHIFSADILNSRTLPPLFKKSSPIPQSELKADSFPDTLTVQSLNSQILGSIDFSKCILSKYNLTDFLSYDPAFSFDEVLACQFLEIYFTRLQFKYPLLAKEEVFAFHNYYTQLNGQPSSGGINRANNSFMYNFFQKYNMGNLENTWNNNGLAKDYHYSCSRSWLIFAISSCLHKTSGKYRGLPPNRYFSTAIRHLAKCQDNLNPWEKVEILSLSLQYIIRTDRDSIELYIILEDIVDISLSTLRLHDLSDCQDNVELKNKKLRVFWSVYLLERMICNAVEKPFLIDDSIIPKDYPLFDFDSFEKGILVDETTDNRSPEEKVHFINRVIKLRKLESKFATDLDLMNWKNNKNQIFDQKMDRANLNSTHSTKSIEMRKSELPKMEFYYKELCSWRSSCLLKQFRAFETETLKLYYYRSVRLLIQPYLDLLKPHNKLFRECQAAAGQICQLYKIFHQKTVFGHSTSAVHTVFSAGLTLIYCLWLARNHDDQRRRKLGDSAKHTRPTLTGTLIASFDDLRACSVSLYVMAERSRFAVIYRDTFDQLMQCTIGNLIERSGPNSSELIPTKSVSNERESYLKHCKTIGEYAEATLEEEEEEDDDEENRHITGYSAASQSNPFSKSGIPAAINRHFGVKQELEHSGFLQNMSVDTEEQQELKRRRGVLKKTMIPQPLSNLLDAYDSEKKLSNNVKKDKPDKQLFGGSNEMHHVKSEEKVKYEESDHLKQQLNTDRFVSASAEQNEGSSSSSFGSPKYFVQKPLQNPTEEEWRNLELKALIKQQTGQQSLQAYLTGVPTTIHNDIIQNADPWDFNFNDNNANNTLFEKNKPRNLSKVANSPPYNFLQDYSNGTHPFDNINIQASWAQKQANQSNLNHNLKINTVHSLNPSEVHNKSPPKTMSSKISHFTDNLNALPSYGQSFGRNNNAVPINDTSHNNSSNAHNGALNKNSTSNPTTINDHLGNPITQSTVQHMISNISQWTSAGFEDFFFDDSQLQSQNQQDNQVNE